MKDLMLMSLERNKWREERFGRPRGQRFSRQKTAREIQNVLDGPYRQILMGRNYS